MKRRISALALAGALFLSLSACTPDAAEPTPSATPTATTTPIPTVTPTPTPVPAEELVIDRHRVEYDRPEDYRLDIAIPMLREDLPGAAELNDQIAEDYDFYLNTPPEDYLEEGDCLNFDYSFVHIWHETYTFGRLYELVVRYQEYSLYGSGTYSWNTVYCYDAEAGTALPLTDFLDRIGVSQADVLSAARAFEDDEGAYESFDELIRFFYIDGDKNVIIELNA